jgi:uncharacterized membrane protein (UPF0127 family)
MNRHILLGILFLILLVGGFIIFEALPRSMGPQTVDRPSQTHYLAPKKIEPEKTTPAFSGRPTLNLGGEIFEIDTADTPAERAQGLSGRASLGKNEGMLFIFSKAGHYGFWMKDMNFPIDIIWIKDGHIIGWAAEAEPDDRPDRTVYYPPEPVNKVLEVPAGTVARLGLQIGDIIK